MVRIIWTLYKLGMNLFVNLKLDQYYYFKRNNDLELIA